MLRSGTPELISDPDRKVVLDYLVAARPLGCSRLGDALPEAATAIAAAAAIGSGIVGYAQAALVDRSYHVDCVADEEATRGQLLTAVLAVLPPGRAVTWWGHEHASDLAQAASLDMAPPFRRLLNMVRPLPCDVAATTDVVTRPFVPGSDDLSWLQVNNAAFSWHSEQGDWTLDTLRARISEQWFDREGFLLHERDGRLAAFCWTKVHAAGVGEIFAIAVHPDFHGLGLGRALTLAGLRHLSETGSTSAMLYVEADNLAAVRLYESLGFHTAHTDVAFFRPAAGDTL